MDESKYRNNLISNALTEYERSLLMEFVLFIKDNQGLRSEHLDIEWVNSFLGRE